MNFDENMNVTLSESEWFQNSSHICFASDVETKCGSKDICSQKGILLPLFIEVTWPWWLRVGLYFGGRCGWIKKLAFQMLKVYLFFSNGFFK